MRLEFCLFGDIIFLDSMKQQQNYVDWPYIGPTLAGGGSKMGLLSKP